MGVARYLHEAKQNNSLKFLDLLAHVSSALAAGLIVGSFCTAYGINSDLKTALVSVAGWAGATIMEAASKQLAGFIPVFFERIRLSIGVMAGFEAKKPADEVKTEEEQKENKE